MRHLKKNLKLGRTSSHNRCMIANLLKSLIEQEKIVTTVAKAKELRRHADRMITLAKKNTLAGRRHAVSRLMIRYNSLTGQQARQVKNGNTVAYNADRRVIKKLFESLGPRFKNREGGYTRLVRHTRRLGDNAQTCVLEFLSD